jgi:hypothetical protein
MIADLTARRATLTVAAGRAALTVAAGGATLTVVAGRAALAVVTGDDDMRFDVDPAVVVLLGIDDDDAPIRQRGGVGGIVGVPIPDAEAVAQGSAVEVEALAARTRGAVAFPSQ